MSPRPENIEGLQEYEKVKTETAAVLQVKSLMPRAYVLKLGIELGRK
jgi:hypothetical protein